MRGSAVRCPACSGNSTPGRVVTAEQWGDDVALIHKPAQVVDPAEHVWSDLGWRGRRWEEIVLYELHVGAFSQNGDFAGVILHLDHIDFEGRIEVVKVTMPRDRMSKMASDHLPLIADLRIGFD